MRYTIKFCSFKVFRNRRTIRGTERRAIRAHKSARYGVVNLKVDRGTIIYLYIKHTRSDFIGRLA